MLTTPELQRLCERVTYRPGWTIQAKDTPEGPMVRIVAPVGDSTQPDHRIDLGIDTWPSPNDLRSFAAFVCWLSWRMRRVEIHESREWLKLDGHPIDYPH